MWRMQCVLALAALYVGLAHSFSWDFVTNSGSQLEFYFNGRFTHSEKITSGNIKYITYDAVGNRMFFVESENPNTAIFSYDITTKKTESLVLRSNESLYILGIAFDPVEELIFWNEFGYNTRICSFSLKTGFKNNAYGKPLIELSKRLKYICAITVDSCRGYIYWTMADVALNILSSIERARFDGSGREVLIGSNLGMPYRLILDHQTQKLYWTNGTDIDVRPTVDKHFFIESADLNGKNRTILYNETGIDQPMNLAVSKDSIYWVHRFQRTVYQLSKNPSIHEKPKEIAISSWDKVATNYKIDDQIRGIQDCEGLKRLLPNNSVTDDNASLNISSDVSLFCVNGKKISGKSQCQCTHGYTGERCDVSVCQNYCFQGDCIVSAEEEPTCRCNAGYSGERCQVNDCQGYCLNDGICSLNEESQPVCQCKGYYEGKRCDVSICLNKCFQKVVSMVWGIINADAQATLDKGVKSTCAPTAV